MHINSERQMRVLLPFLHRAHFPQRELHRRSGGDEAEGRVRLNHVGENWAIHVVTPAHLGSLVAKSTLRPGRELRKPRNTNTSNRVLVINHVTYIASVASLDAACAMSVFIWFVKRWRTFCYHDESTRHRDTNRRRS